MKLFLPVLICLCLFSAHSLVFADSPKDIVNLEEYCGEYCANCDAAGNPVAGSPDFKYGPGCGPGKEKCFCSPIPWSGGIMELVDRVTNWLFWAILVCSGLMIVVGGLFMMTSAGQPEQVKKGRSIITWALIGLAIVASARLLAAVVIRILGGA
ncbi:MAG: pilin [Candidatus Pacebacteria bacterium]|nr:pilin [Candidatus Paceibacterota bacterium]